MAVRFTGRETTTRDRGCMQAKRGEEGGSCPLGMAYCLLVTRAFRFCVAFAHPCQEMEGFARLAIKYNLFVLSDEVSLGPRFCAGEG